MTPAIIDHIDDAQAIATALQLVAWILRSCRHDLPADQVASLIQPLADCLCQSIDDAKKAAQAGG